MSRDEQEDLSGKTLGPYRVESRLGAGGMGIVYRARDARLDREVAIKVLPAALAGDGERRARFLREAKSAAAVSHPNIATVYDVGEGDGRVYLAMELVEGTTLRRRLAGKPLPPPDALRIARAIAAGLARAHDKGIIHRDLKPENVMVTPDGGVKILDFGLAKLRETDSTDGAIESQETQTLEGRVMGTPGYMSPEQASGRAVDARTDVYALGVVLHEMLTGGLPGVGTGRRAIGDARLEAVVARCLAPTPEERWPDAGSVLAALEGAGTPRTRSRWPLLLGAALPIAVAAAVAAAWSHRAPASASASASAPTSSASPSASAAPSATTYTDQPLPPSDVPEARAEYAAGMQAMRDDTWALAQRHFTRAAQLDPSMAAAHLRYAILASVFVPDVARNEFTTASSLRARLSEHDRVLLEAVEPSIGRVHKDNALAVQRLEAAAERWPGDVELLDLVSGFGNASAERVLEASQRAMQLDPHDVEAAESLGNALTLYGRYDEARAALEQGTVVAPQSGDIFLALSQLESVAGRCEEMRRDARRAADIDRHQGLWFLLWAETALRSPAATLREIVEQHAAAESEAARGIFRGLDEADVATLEGRFDEARAALDGAAAAVAQSVPTAYMWHLFVAQQRVHLALETGDGAEARRVASDFMARRETWTRSLIPHGVGGVDHTPWLARVASDRPRGIDAMRSAWIDEQLRDGATAGFVWSYGWAATALTRDEALDALDARDHDGRLQPQLPGQPLTAMFLGIPDAYTGHLYMLAGRPADAVAPLRRAVAQCSFQALLFDHVHAQLDLAAALEQTGDPKGACDAYGEVLSRWGHATPRSVSAETARDGVRRLHCAP